MTTKQIEKEWNKIIAEVHDKPKVKTSYPPEVLRARELLLFAEITCGNVVAGDKSEFHQELCKIVMPEYYRQKRVLKI